jgi:non-heme chloroperoxidase
MFRKRIVVLFTAGLLLTGAASMAKDADPWTDKYLKVGDIKIHYLEAGTGDRPLVFIPGWTMIAEIWKEQIPYFVARGFRVIIWEPRSQGLTTKTETGNSYQQQAADLHAFLKELRIQHAALVGWSAGVSVLLEYVASPETVRPEKLVLVEGLPAGLKEGDYPGGMTIQQARSTILGFQDDRAKATDKFVRSMFKQHQGEILYKEIISGSLKTPIGAATALFFDLLTGDRRPALAHIDTPTLIIMTTDNRSIGEYLQSKISGSKLEVIENAGHAVFIDKPQAFNQALEAFLEAR